MSGRVIVRREAADLVLALALQDVEQLQAGQMWTDPIPADELAPIVEAAERAFIDELYGDNGLRWGAAADAARNDEAMVRAQGIFAETMHRLRGDWLTEHAADDEPNHQEE